MPVAEEKLVKNQVVILKDNWGYQGSKEYSKLYSLITKSLETNFGTSNSLNGKDDGNTRYRIIQDQVVDNY